MKYTPSPGDVVVLRGLRANPKLPTSAHIGSRIGQISRLLPGGRIYVRLHMGGAFTRSTHFSARGRVCELANVARLATARERLLGEIERETAATSVAA